jgi:hypothetical protein
MRILRTLVRFVAIAVVAAVVLTTGLAVGGTAVHAWRFAVVQGDAMQPALLAGDVVVLRPVSADQLHPGQVLDLPAPGSGSTDALRRIESVRAATGHLVVRTDVDTAMGTNPALQETSLPTISTAWVASKRIPLGATGLGKVIADPRLRSLSLETVGAAAILAAVLVTLGRVRRRRSTPAEPQNAPFSEEWWRLLARS